MYFSLGLVCCVVIGTMLVLANRRAHRRRREALVRRSRLLIRTVMSGACVPDDLSGNSTDGLRIEVPLATAKNTPKRGVGSHQIHRRGIVFRRSSGNAA